MPCIEWWVRNNVDVSCGKMQQRKVNIYLYVSRMKGVGIAEAKDTSTQPMSEFYC